MDVEITNEVYTLNEDEALKILNVPIKKIKNTDVQHDFMLSREERINQARKILDSNR